MLQFYFMSVLLYNQDKYVQLLAEFKVKTSTASEVAALQNGFWKVHMHNQYSAM